MIYKKVVTPATEHLFQVRDTGAVNLSAERARIFHSTVVKLLFVAKWGRPDIILVISFLTTRVKQPDEDDWKKLCRVLNYLHLTSSLVLTLSCENLDKLTWYIDGSYAVHGDVKGQSSEILVTNGPMVQWTKNFAKEQGYDLETVLKEDNRSAMLLMKNGQLSAGKHTKHLDIHYFYIKDLLGRGIITVDHCISDKMIVNFFTKPIQGHKFQIFRDIILNRRDPDYALQYRSVLGTGDREDIVQAESVPDTHT